MKALAASIAGWLFLGASGAINAADPLLPPYYKLPPARSLVGVWKTPFYVTFYTKMESGGVFKNVASERRNITWVITKGLDNYSVNIRQTVRRKDFKVLNPPDIAMPPFVGDSPYLFGKISGTRMTVVNGSGKKCGTFTFTTDLMAGTWDFTEKVGIYKISEFYTRTNQLKFTKR